MKKYFIIFLMVLELAWTWSLQSITLADAPLAKELSISQIKITGDEFLVLRNTTSDNLQLSNYWLYYFNDFDLTRTSSASSSQLPDVWLQPTQEILLSTGTAASCGPVWVSKLPFGLKDSAGMLQVINLSQTGGIVGYQPEDQVSWSSKSGDIVDVKPVSGSSSSQIYHKTEEGWAQTSTPPGCSATSASTSSATNTPDTLAKSSLSPPSVLLNEADETGSDFSIPAADTGLMAPLLSEVLPNPGAPKTDANDEYIELYNPNDKTFDLSGFKLQAGTANSYSYTFPNDKFSLLPNEFRAFYSSQTNLPLSNSASEVRLLSPDNDILAQSDVYSDAAEDQAWILADGLWQWTSAPSPNARNVTTTSGGGNVLSSNSGSVPPPTSSSKTYLPLELSELLPNPKSPQTDAEDEFVEIYNPNNKAVNFDGYILVTGTQDNHKYTLGKGTIGAGAYKAFYSSATHLTLSNSSGHAKILAPNGSQIDASDDYTKAPEGQSWIYANGKWQWTTSPTPDKANVFVASATTSNTAGTGARATNSSSANSAGSTAKSSSLHPLILAGVGGAVLLYAIYEYRHDLANQYYRLRRNRTPRRAAGQITKTPGTGGAQI